MSIHTPHPTDATPVSRVKHAAHLARHFGKVRSFALEALLHLALSQMPRDFKASTGHTISQNLDAMRDMLRLIRNGDPSQDLDGAVFQQILDTENVDQLVLTDAEALLNTLQSAEGRTQKGEKISAEEIEGFFETYTALRKRISGFLRQIEALTAEWQDSDEDISQMRNKMTSAMSDLESMSSAINMLAINASVEASRAGDQGAAFGVIAQEMHRLSSQSAQVLRSTRSSLGL